jgi:hypothetical protein
MKKMIRKQLKNARKGKYEMGNFCEHFGLPLLLHLQKTGRNLVRFLERNLLHITTVTRKENLLNLLKIFQKNPKRKLLNLLLLRSC